MKEIQISTFKAKCLQIIDEVNRTGKPRKITRHGKTIAILTAAPQEQSRNGFGIAKGTIEIKEEIIEPVINSTDWEVLN